MLYYLFLFVINKNILHFLSRERNIVVNSYKKNSRRMGIRITDIFIYFMNRSSCHMKNILNTCHFHIYLIIFEIVINKVFITHAL